MAQTGLGPHTLKREYYDALRQLTLELAGIHLGRDHAFLIETRLSGLARTEGFPSLASMVDELFAHGQNRLAVRVVSALLERDTRFFSDPNSLQLFATRVLPQLHDDVIGRPIRVLSFGCASGQEVWTLAMIREQMKRRLPGLHMSITGVDYPSAALERGRTGVYSHFEVQRGLPVRKLMAHFQPHGASDSWAVKDALRAGVEFQDFHLLSRLDPLGEYDCVIFRGSLGRYSGPAQVRVLRGVASVVRENGFLLMGSDETVANGSYGFEGVGDHPNLLCRRLRAAIVEDVVAPPKKTTFGPQG